MKVDRSHSITSLWSLAAAGCNQWCKCSVYLKHVINKSNRWCCCCYLSSVTVFVCSMPLKQHGLQLKIFLILVVLWKHVMSLCSFLQWWFPPRLVTREYFPWVTVFRSIIILLRMKRETWQCINGSQFDSLWFQFNRLGILRAHFFSVVANHKIAEDVAPRWVYISLLGLHYYYMHDFMA